MSHNKFKESLTQSGYDPEEAYFHEESVRLIEEIRKKTAANEGPQSAHSQSSSEENSVKSFRPRSPVRPQKKAA